MSTPAQIAANQANSKLSTGPTSEIGKQIVSQNSVKHHFTSKGNPALPGEEDAVEKHVEGYFQTYAPIGIPEQDLVRNLAENNWRLTRLLALERRLFVRLETVEPEAFDDTLKELRRTSTYAHRVQRAIEKTRAELKSLQSGRKSAYDQAQEEAILLTQLAHAKGQTLDPPKTSRPLNTAVALFIPCPKSCASSTAKSAWRRPRPASPWPRSPAEHPLCNRQLRCLLKERKRLRRCALP